MKSFSKKEKATSLRKRGFSLGDISSRVGISKSTASIWCRDVKLSKKQQEVLRENRIRKTEPNRQKGADKNRMLKIERIKEMDNLGITEIGGVSRRDFFIAGVGLYLGEGSKTERFSFVNSDPELILFMIKWIKLFLKVDSCDLMPRLFVNEIHEKNVDNILSFWSKKLNLPVTQFGRATVMKYRQKKVYSNQSGYKGVVALRVRNSKNFLYKMWGLMKALKRGI